MYRLNSTFSGTLLRSRNAAVLAGYKVLNSRGFSWYNEMRVRMVGEGLFCTVGSRPRIRTTTVRSEISESTLRGRASRSWAFSRKHSLAFGRREASSLSSVRRSGVVCKPLREPAPVLELAVTWRKGDLSANLQAFLEVVREFAPVEIPANAPESPLNEPYPTSF